MIRPIAAIAGIVIIECVALMNGIDGTIMLTSVAIIAGLGGYTLKTANLKETIKALPIPYV